MRTRKPAVRKLMWFGVKTVFRVAATGRPVATDSAFDPQMTLVEERVVLYRATSGANAIRAAERDARAYSRDTHRNPYGQRVVWRYLGACEAYEMFEPPGDGREVFSTTEVVPKTRTDRSVISQRVKPVESRREYRSRRNILDQEFAGAVRRNV